MPNALPTPIKLVMLQGAFVASGTYKVSLHNSSYSTATTTYSTTNEVSGTGYMAGGAALAGVTTTTSGTTAYGDANDVVWSSATISGARFAVVYDTVNGPNRIVAIYDFGADQSVVSGTLTIVWPTPDATNAMLRVS